MLDLSYRRVSSLAIASAALGIVAFLSFVIPQLAVIVVPAALLLGGIGRRLIGRYEHCGAGWAGVGIVSAALICVSLPLSYVIAYRLEAPFSYTRLDFEKSTKGPDPQLDSFVGERICLKGYISPYHSEEDTSLVLMPHLTESSFRVNKHSVGLVVQLPPGEKWKWTESRIAVFGTLIRKQVRQYDSDPPVITYLLNADGICRSLIR